MAENNKGEILIVEDTPASLKLLSDLLTDAGFYVRQAPNGELALWTAQSRPPELILLDVRMPGIDGYEVCRRLKESPELRDIPVIFLSAQYETDDKVRGFELGAVDFIAKPFQSEEVLARTDSHVRLARTQRALAQERSKLEERVRERTAQLAATAEDLRLAGQVFDATLDAVFVTDTLGLIVTVNPAFTRITGYTREEVLGKPPGILRHGLEEGGLLKDVLRALESDGYWSGEVMNRHKSGSTHPGILSVTAARDQGGTIRNYVAVFSDISERKREQSLIDFLSSHDSLTGLPNRQTARGFCDSALAEARREGGSVVLMCLDLDHFKVVNDTLGHAFADNVLQAAGRLLEDLVPANSMVTRQGGDEFQLILRDSGGLEQTVELAQRLLRTLRDDLVVDGQPVSVTSSIGIAVSPNDGANFDELLGSADTALVRAKEMGRDCYAFFTDRMDADMRANLAILGQLRGAAARNEFELHYQPQVCLRTGQVTGAEALLRWTNPVLGAVPPGRFIPLAEEYGQVVEIGEWVLDQACAQMARWRAAGLVEFKVSVNLSARQFGQERTVGVVEEALRRHGVAASNLCLEITEGTVMGDPARSAAALARLKEIGVSISLDDFGTGYSSLAYLKRFPIDVLKIDKSFVDDVADSAAGAAIALSVISLAHNLGMRVVAEGVELRTQVGFLAAHGCDEMQGYYFSKPLAVPALDALLAEGRVLALDQARGGASLIGASSSG